MVRGPAEVPLAQDRWWLGAVSILVALSVLMAVLGTELVPVPAVVMAAVVAAIGSTWRRVATVAAAGFVVAAVAVTLDRFDMAFNITRLVLTAVLSALAVAVVFERERRDAELARREAELAERRQLALALEASRLGTWRWDDEERRLHWDAHMQQLHGLAPGSFDGRFASFMALVHPEDAPRLRRAGESARRSGPVQLEYRIVRPDGVVRWLETRGEVVDATAGRRPGLIGVSVDVTERRSGEEERAALLVAEQEARQQSVELAMSLARLQRITAALSGATTPAEVAQRLVEEGASALAATTAYCATVDEEARVLQVRAVVNPRAELGPVLRRMHLDDDLPAPEAVRTGHLVLFEDAAERDLRYPRLAGTALEPTWATLPLFGGGRILGCVGFGWSEARTFDDDEIRFMEAVSETCGQALHRAVLAEAESQVQARLAFLLRASEAISEAGSEVEVARTLARQAAEGIGAWAAVSLLDEEGVAQRVAVAHADPSRDQEVEDVLAGFEPTGRALVTQVAVTQEPLVLTDVHPQALPVVERDPSLLARLKALPWRSNTTVPMTAGDTVMGALSVGSGRHLRKADVALATDLAKRAALLLERARLDRAEREARDRLAFLSEATAIVAATLDRQEVLERLARMVVPRLGDWVVVYQPEGDGLVRTLVHHADPRRQADCDLLRTAPPVPLDSDIPVTRAFRGARPEVVYPASVEELSPVTQEAHIAAVGRLGVAGVLAVPVAVRGRALGVLAVCTADPARRFSVGDAELLLDLAARVAVAVEHASAFERQHDTAEALQRAILPDRVEVPEGWDLAARYLPASLGSAVGGDWWDAFPLAEGQVGLVVGDVSGHGLRSAALMGQLRNAVRAYAIEGHSPAAVLSCVDHLLDRTGEEGFASVVIVAFDPKTGDLCWANAGHPPPVVVRADGALERLAEPHGIVLGALPGSRYQEGRRALQPGDVLCTYTDGLIEQRGVHIDAGLAALDDALLDVLGEPADEICDVLVPALLGAGERDDDTCLVVLRRLDGDPGAVPGEERRGRRIVELELPGATRAAGEARDALAAVLAPLVGVDGEAADRAALCVSELVTNALLHGQPPLRLLVTQHGERLRVAVEDAGEGQPIRRDAGPEDLGGRGILLLDRLADEWGVDRRGGGKQVWFEVALGPT